MVNPPPISMPLPSKPIVTPTQPVMTTPAQQQPLSYSRRDLFSAFRSTPEIRTPISESKNHITSRILSPGNPESKEISRKGFIQGLAATLGLTFFGLHSAKAYAQDTGDIQNTTPQLGPQTKNTTPTSQIEDSAPTATFQPGDPTKGINAYSEVQENRNTITLDDGTTYVISDNNQLVEVKSEPKGMWQTFLEELANSDHSLFAYGTTLAETIATYHASSYTHKGLTKLGIPNGNRAYGTINFDEIIRNRPYYLMFRTAVVAPVIEEIMFRYYLGKTLTGSVRGPMFWKTGIAQALAFGFAHNFSNDWKLHKKDKFPYIDKLDYSISAYLSIPASQIIYGVYTWYAMRKKGIIHPLISHSMINGYITLKNIIAVRMDDAKKAKQKADELDAADNEPTEEFPTIEELFGDAPPPELLDDEF